MSRGRYFLSQVLLLVAVLWPLWVVLAVLAIVGLAVGPLEGPR